MDYKDVAIQVEHVAKEYHLGVYNYTTLMEGIQSRWARWRGKEDPTLKIGAKEKHIDGNLLCAVNDVSFTVHKGESFGIIGANGAGKSTLLKLICQVTAPTRGTIGINGRISSMLEVGVGFMPELTGRENIFLSGAVLGMNRKEVASKLDAIAAFSECEEFLDTPLKRYSSGMRVKLGFSIAAHLDNEIMIMDEVLAVGDIRFQKKCLDRMSQAVGQEGKTVLYVSHNMNTIRQLCSRCIVMDKGEIVFDGDTERAISLYCDQFSTLSCDVDLKKCQHPTRGLGGLALNRWRVRDREIAVYERGETITAEIEWEAERDIDAMLPMMLLSTKDGEPLAWLLGTPIEAVRRGKRSCATFVIDIGDLAVGEYCLSIVMTDPKRGRLFQYDAANRAFFFDVVSSHVAGDFSTWSRSRDGFFIRNHAIDCVAYTED